MTRIEKALENHKKGYNCAQAVACAYCDLYGVDEKTAFMMAEGFGGGMGGLMETCGALTGAFMLAGLNHSKGDLQNPRARGASYKMIRAMAQAFTEKNQSIICRELKGVGGGPVLRSCAGCVEDACTLFEQQMLIEEKVPPSEG